jgi:hypothetical protein
VKAWAAAHGTPTSCDVFEGDTPPEETLLHVNDPGAAPPEGAIQIPIEQLWSRVDDVPHNERMTIVAGHGVRAALGVGILERAGVETVSFWWRRQRSALVEKKRRGSFLRPFAD